MSQAANNATSLQVQADVHNVICQEMQEEENKEDETWELDRSAKRRRMDANRKNDSTVGSGFKPPSRSRKASIASNCSEAWEVIDYLGEEELPPTKKGPTKDQEINDQLLKGFLLNKMDTDVVDEVDLTEDNTGESDEIDATEGEQVEDITDEVEDFSDHEVFVQDDSTTPKYELDVTSIGSSNMRDVGMDGDQDLKINFHSYVSKGMPIREAHERLDEIDEEEKATLPMMVVNVGACDFKYDREVDILELGMNYGDLIEEIKYQCPEASIIVSSVLPKSGKGSDEEACKKMNEEILSFNSHLRAHCDPLLDVHFVDNYLFSVDREGEPCKALYADDVHLGPRGKEKLSASLFQVIKNVYFGRRLRKELLEKSFLSKRLRSEFLEKDDLVSP